MDQRNLGLASQKDIGAVGCKILSVSNYILNVAIIINDNFDIENFRIGLLEKEKIYFNILNTIHEYSVISCSCLMIERSKFMKVKKFDEIHTSGRYAEVDLCLKLKKNNYFNVINPYIKVHLHEGSKKIIQENSYEKVSLKKKYLKISNINTMCMNF